MATQNRPSPKYILIARPAAVFAEDVTDAYVKFEVHSENAPVGTATTPRFTGMPAKMVREWKGEYKIPVGGEVTSLDIKLFGKVAGDRVAPEGEDLLVASGYLDSRDMKAFYGFHRVLLQFGNHSVKWEVTFVIQPGQGTTSSMSRAGSLMSRASSQGLSDRLGSLGLTLDNTSVYSESYAPQSPSARSIASSKPPPSQSGYSGKPSGPPSRGPPIRAPQSSPGNSPATSPLPGGGQGDGPRGTDRNANAPFTRDTPDDSPQARPNGSPPAQRPPSGFGNRSNAPSETGRSDAGRNDVPSGPNNAANGQGPRQQNQAPASSQDMPRTSENAPKSGPNDMPGMMHTPAIDLPSPNTQGRQQPPPTSGMGNGLTSGTSNGPARTSYKQGPGSMGSYSLAGSGVGSQGRGSMGGAPAAETGGYGASSGYGAANGGGYGAGEASKMDIKILTRGAGGGGDDGMGFIGSGLNNSRGVNRSVKTGGACVCSTEYFTVREDRPVVREVTDYVLEHHLYEREYVRQVRYRGEHEVVNTSAAVELIKADERTVAVSQPADPCAALANPARSPAEELRALAQTSSQEGGVSTPRQGANLMHVREGVMGSRNSPGYGGSPFAGQNGAAQTGAVQANGAGQALVSTTVTTKIAPPPKPQGAELCKQEVFRQVEDRPVLKQRTRFMREHHIFEKTYVREVKYAGEVEVATHQTPELVRTEERVVEVTQPCHPCALIKNGLDLDRMSRVQGGYSAGSNGLMTSGHQYHSQGGYGSNCAGGVCKPGAGAYSRFADSSEGMASGKFSSTFSSNPGPLHTFQNSGNFPRRPLQQSINRAGIIQPTNKGYMG
ncbi:hypothetical protein WJX74_010973 [Apatococcus lobatus]|uniref:Uncharacterized protein n=2 Tax=Apatococcus TaxID=904362 RepID=A0AAW1T1A6_9CHLO